MSHEFEELIARVRQADEDATSELIEKYEYEVRLTARILLGPGLRRHLDSVDMTQSVHLALIKGLQDGKFEFEKPENLVALAVAILRRKIALRWRRMKKQTAIEEKLASQFPPEDPSETDPMVTAEFQDAVSVILEQITSAADRQVVELRLEGFSIAEAARKLGLDPDVTRVRLGRLRKRLRDRGVLSDWI